MQGASREREREREREKSICVLTGKEREGEINDINMRLESCDHQGMSDRRKELRVSMEKKVKERGRGGDRESDRER